VIRISPGAEGAFWRVASWALPPVIAVVFIVGIAPELLPSWRAAIGDGTRGTFTSQHASCGKSECSYFGPFVSLDGRVRFSRARLTEPNASLERGQTASAIYTGSAEAQVFLAGQSEAWLIDTPIFGAACIGLAIWAFRARKALRSRRDDP
jgi:hypothetical protein